MKPSVRLAQNVEEQENKIANYLDKQRFVAGNDKKGLKTLKTTINHDKKRIASLSSRNDKKVYGHNFSLKFPLQDTCKIPFSNNMRVNQLNFNKQFLLDLDNAFIRQTTRHLIVYPKFEALPAIAGNSVELKAILRAKCLGIVKHLQERYTGLKVIVPGEPSTQEYAIKSEFAARVPFSFKNDIGVIDKSGRIDSDGHKVTGGEAEWFSPEHADLYLKMPLMFSEITREFNQNLGAYSEQIKLHLSILKDMKESLRAMRPQRERLSSFKKSATLRAVN